MEKREFVDQKEIPEAKFAAISAWIRRQRELFQRQGTVVASWRKYRGHRLGPFFALRYRVEGRQLALYLGRSAELAAEVQGLLAEVQQQRELATWQRQARLQLRKYKEGWRRELAAAGLRLQGFEVRGWRGLQGAAGSPADSSEATRQGQRI